MPTPSAPAAAPAGFPLAFLRLSAPLAALPLAALAVFLFFSLRAEVTGQARTELLRAAAGLSAVLETELAADTRALEALAASPRIGVGDVAAFREEARRLLAQQPAWHTLALVDAERQVMNLRFLDGAPLPPSAELPPGPVLQTGRTSPEVMPDGGLALRVPVRVDGAIRYALIAVVPTLSLGQALERAGLPPGSSALLADERRVVARAGSTAVPDALFRPVLASPGGVVELEDGWLGTARALSGARWLVAVVAPVGRGLVQSHWLLFGALGLSATLAGAGVLLHRRAAADRPPEPVARPGIVVRRTELLAEFTEALGAPFPRLRASHEAVSRLELPAEARPLLHAGRQAAEEAEAILADMRDVAGLEAGILTVEEADIDLPAALEDCVAAVRGAALAKEVPLHLAADPGLPRWIRGDPRRLRRVLTGMLREAVAGASAGEVTLSARLAPQPGSVEILVSDAAAPGTGGGRPPSALCRLLAAAMGGGLTTEEAGRLVLRLPFRPGAPPAPPGRGLRVLVAEDVAAARLLLTAVLERGGHRVTATEDGARALAALHGGSFDMLILDLHMPGMDGCGVAAAVRAMPGETGRVPILALTADPPEEVEAGCREAGFDAVLRKPFETRRLLGVVEALRGRTDGVAREASRMAAG